MRIIEVSSSKFSNSLSGPPRVSQSGVELEKNFECDFMASDDAYGSGDSGSSPDAGSISNYFDLGDFSLQPQWNPLPTLTPPSC